MSLIANALKAAQQEKDKRTRGGTAQERRVRSLVGDPHARGLSAPRASGGTRTFSPLAIVLTVVLVAIVAGGVIFRDWFRSQAGSDTVAETAAPRIEPLPASVEVPANSAADALYADATIGQADPVGIVTEEVAAAPRRPSTSPASDMERQPIADSPQPGTFTPAPRGLAAPVEGIERPGAGNFRLSVDVPAEDITQLLRRAMRAYGAGEYTTATDLYTRAIAAGAASAEVYNNLGVAYRAMGDLTRARSAYQRALDLDPRNAGSWSNLGVVMDALGEADQATAAYQRALEFDPANAPAKVNLARHYHAGKLLADARRLFEEAIRFDPLLAEAHYGLARVLEDQGDREGAIRHYQNFLNTHADRFPREAASVRRRLQELTGRAS